MFVLDTNVVSELRPGKPKPSPSVRRWAATQSAATLYLTSITILELELGVQALEKRTPPQGSALRAWLNALRQAFAGRVLPFGDAAAVVCATLKTQRSRSERDAMIAACALEHGFAVITRNTRDFEGMGLRLVNPWDPVV